MNDYFKILVISNIKLMLIYFLFWWLVLILIIP